MKINFKIIILLCLVSIGLTNCVSVKQIGKDEKYLYSNTIKANRKDINIAELESYIRQSPNRKLFGQRLRLKVYQHAFIFKNWFKTAIGEAPVIFDTVQANKSVKQLEIFLNNIGFFGAKASYSINNKWFSRKSIIVNYKINAPDPYYINNIYYNIKDPSIRSIVVNDSTNSLLKKGIRYDARNIYNERIRIDALLKNSGYYEMSPENISFNIDSAYKNKTLSIEIILKNLYINNTNNPDSIIERKLERFKIGKIYIYPSFNPVLSDSIAILDTLEYTHYNRNDSAKYYFIFNDKLKMKSKIIAQNIFFYEGDYYSSSNSEATYNRLTDLRSFKYVTIKYKRDDNQISKTPLLQCRIQLSDAAKYSYTQELEGTFSNQNYGIFANTGFNARNVFKGSEFLSVKLKGALENQKITVGTENQTSKYLINVFEIGGEVNLIFPRFLIPYRKIRVAKLATPQTAFHTSINYEKRKGDYERTILNLNYGYEWNETKTKKHKISPIVISSVKVNPDSLFLEKIKELRNKRLLNNYQDYLTAGISYSFTYRNQNTIKNSNYSILRFNTETSGNSLHIGNQILKSTKFEDQYYKLFGIRFAQYFRADIDYRYYWIFPKKDALVFRGFFGWAFAYGNSKTMPFEKSYFVGGPNSIRAWQLRSIGPGTYYKDETSFYDKVGDLAILSNLEYRFGIYKMFKGAVFIDAGNVWLNNINSNFPGGTFYWNKFYKELAIANGIGLRLDISGLFIIRVDGALSSYDPRKEEKKRFVLFRNRKLSDIVWNFGIGFPF